jgi:MFS family permease
MQASGMPASAYGWVAGAMGLGSVWLYMANAAFTTPLGPVRATAAAALLSALGVGFVLTGDFPLMLAGALLIGFGYAATTPAGSQIMADHTPRTSRATLFSIRQAGVPLGGAIAGAGGSYLATRYGWRTALATFGGLAALAAPLLLAAPRHFNETRPRPRFRMRALFAAANLGAPFRTLRQIPKLRRIALACIGFSVVQGTVNTFFTLYATRDLGLSLLFAGGLFAIMQVASVTGRVVLGFVADRLGSPLPVLRCLAALSALSALLLASLGADWPPWQLQAAVAFMGLSVATWNGLYLAETASIAPDSVSEAAAATTFFVFATYMLAPPLMGLIIHASGYRAAFVAAALSALTSLLVLLLPARLFG